MATTQAQQTSIFQDKVKKYYGPKKLELKWDQGIMYGVNPADVTKLDGLKNVRGVVAREFQVERFRGFSTFLGTAGSGDAIKACPAFTLTNNLKYACLVTLSRFYKYNSLTNSWVDLGSYVGGLDDYVSWTFFNDDLIFTSKHDTVKNFDGTTYGALTGLTGTSANCCASFKSRVLLGGVDESATWQPWKVMWTIAGDSTDWTGTGSGFQMLLDNPGEILAMGVMVDRLFVYKTDSIWEGVYIGGTDIFRFVPIVPTTGCIAGGTLAAIAGVEDVQNMHIFLGTDDVYMFDGRDAHPVATGKVREYLFGAKAVVDSSKLRRSVGYYDPEDRIYYLWVVKAGATYPGLMLALDLRTRSWWVDEPSIYITAVGTERVGYVSLPPWTDTTGIWTDYTTVAWTGEGTIYNIWSVVSGSWDQQTASWSGKYSDLVASPQNTVIGTSTGVVYKLDFNSYLVAGSAPTAYLESGDYISGPGIRWFRVSVELSGGNATLHYSTDEGVTWTSMGSKAGGVNQFTWVDWYFNMVKEKMRFKVVLDANCSKVRDAYALASPKESN